MVSGKSIMHAPQPMGKYFSSTEIKGYYNDLTNKVRLEKAPYGELPIDEEKGKTTEFPIQVFQYGLAAYDMYLETKDEGHLKTFWVCVRWSEEHMEENGCYITFPKAKDPHSAMAQGEAVSLFARAYVVSEDGKYKELASRSMKYLKESTSEQREGIGTLLQEYVGEPIVLNGMIFAMFGIYDYALLTGDGEDKAYWLSILESLKNILPVFDTGKWSLYREDGRYVSKFYMGLHIAQMQALYVLTGEDIFKTYGERWAKYLRNPFRRWRYFWKKAWQKIKE